MVTDNDRHKKGMRVGTWNVRGVNDEGKMCEVLQVFEESKLDVCGLTNKIEGMRDLGMGEEFGQE